MVARTLKADAFENKFLCKFNLDPGSLMVLDMPLVPFFLTWTEQVLRVASDRMMFSSHTGACVQMISLKRSSHRHSGCLDHRLLELLLGIIIEGDLRLHNWTLFNDNSWLHDRVYLSLDHTFAVMVEDDLSQLETLGAVLVVETELDLLGVSVNFREVNCMPSLKTESELSVRDLVPSTFQHVEHMDLYFCG